MRRIFAVGFDANVLHKRIPRVVFPNPDGPVTIARGRFPNMKDCKRRSRARRRANTSTNDFPERSPYICKYSRLQYSIRQSKRQRRYVGAVLESDGLSRTGFEILIINSSKVICTSRKRPASAR